MRRPYLFAIALVALVATAVIAENEVHVNRAQKFNAPVQLAGAGNVVSGTILISGAATITSPTITSPSLTSPTIVSATSSGADTFSSGTRTVTGATANATIVFTSSTSELRVNGPARFTNFSLPTRYGLSWVAGYRGKPGLNADATSATDATREVADMFFEILGTNAVDTDVAYYAEGGITLTTHGASADSTILLPHLTTNLSPWTGVTWGSDKQTEWEADFTTGGAITTATIWAGLKLTNTPTVATDNDQVYFLYDSATNSGKWEFVYSIGNVDVEADTGVTVALSTRYHAKIVIDSARVPRGYLNGVLVGTGTALTDATDFKPYIGVKQTAGSITRAVNIHGQAISRVAN